MYNNAGAEPRREKKSEEREEEEGKLSNFVAWIYRK